MSPIVLTLVHIDPILYWGVAWDITGFEEHLRTIQRERANMAKNFQELRYKMSVAARTASEGEYRRLMEEMSMHQLRKARELTQTKIAEELHMGKGDVSKLERRTDMYVSTLANYLQAMGADLEIRAVFLDDHAVKITQFSEPSGFGFVATIQRCSIA